jgi:hypothetical protein
VIAIACRLTLTTKALYAVSDNSSTNQSPSHRITESTSQRINESTSQRIILLGASNVTLGFPLIVEGLRRSLPAPLELFAAHGHGRSFGMRSRLLVRRLPGIRECELWEALDRRPSAGGRPLALVTDVGNDLLFGVRPDLLLSWVEECVARLRGFDAAVTVTTLPLESVLRMGTARYLATRTVFFPGGGPDWASMRQMAGEVDEGLRRLAAQYACQVMTPRPQWYGIDPIHVRRGLRSAAWSEILSAWPGVDEVRVDPLTLRRCLPFWRLPAAERDVWGQTRRTAQPVWQVGDGSTIWLY